MYSLAPRRATSSKSNPSASSRIRSVELDAVDPLHGQHAGGAVFRERLRNVDRGIVLVACAELLQVPFLAAKIQFPPQNAAHLGDRRRRAIGGQFGNSLGQQGQSRQHIQVLAAPFLDARVLDLDDDLLARNQAGGMDLADGRRGDRCVVELGEQFLHGLSQFLFHQGADQVRWIGRHVGLQLLELVRQLHAGQIGAGAQQLAELDERRPQFGQRQPDPFLRRVACQGLAVPVFQPVLDEIDIEPADPVGQSVLAENRQDLRPAFDVAVDVRNRCDSHGQLTPAKLRNRPGPVDAFSRRTLVILAPGSPLRHLEGCEPTERRSFPHKPSQI